MRNNKSRDRDERGISLPRTSSPQVAHTVEVRTRPLRTALFLQEDISATDLGKVLMLCTLEWGGVYNLLVPFQEDVSPSWATTLRHADPDHFVGIDRRFPRNIDTLFRQTVPLSPLFTLEAAFDLGTREITALRTPYARHVAQQKERRRQLLLPEPSPVFALVAAAQFGQLPNEQASAYQRLAAEIVPKPINNLQEYFDTILATETATTALELTAAGLDTTRTLANPGFPNLWFTTGGVYDIACFWALRQQAGIGHGPSWLLPYQDFSDSDFDSMVAFLLAATPSSNTLRLSSASVPAGTLIRLRDRLKPRLPHLEHIEIQSGTPITYPIQVEASRVIRSVLTRRETTILYGPPSPVPQLPTGALWALELEPPQPDGGRFLPPKSQGSQYHLRYVPETLRSFWPASTRVGDETVVICTSGTDSLQLVLDTNPESVFSTYFADYQRTLAPSEKARYATGLLGLLGENGTELLRADLARAIIQLPATKRYTLNELQERLHQHGTIDDLRTLLARLERATILKRGVENRCPNCEIKNWYPLTELDATLLCDGCGIPFQLALTPNCSWQLNSLVAQAVTQGSIPVVLAAAALQGVANKSSIILHGATLKPDNIDLDIIASIDTYVVIGEVKTLLEPPTRAITEQIIDQVRRTAVCAKQVNADFLLFAYIGAHTELADAVRAAALRESWTMNRVLIFAEDELLRGEGSLQALSLRWRRFEDRHDEGVSRDGDGNRVLRLGGFGLISQAPPPEPSQLG